MLSIAFGLQKQKSRVGPRFSLRPMTIDSMHGLLTPRDEPKSQDQSHDAHSGDGHLHAPLEAERGSCKGQHLSKGAKLVGVAVPAMSNAGQVAATCEGVVPLQACALLRA